MLQFSAAVAADGNEPVQIKLHKSLRLWTFYVDLEESLGTLESTRAVYERILDLRIVTPQIISINYAMLLEVCKVTCIFFIISTIFSFATLFFFMLFFYYLMLPKLKFNLHVLQDHKYFADAFKVYERGVKIFKYSHVKDIWVTYLSKFVKRYGKSKLERCRELFEHAVEMVRLVVNCVLHLCLLCG